MHSHKELVTISSLLRKKERGEKLAMVTAYDYPMAKLVDQAGVDLVLVGDSLANVVQGRETTLSVTLDEMIYHAEMVARAVKRALVVVDIPFPYCQLGPDEAVRAAARIMKETGAGAVKIEGGIKRRETIRTVIDAGIPVMGHCGLQPQSIRLLGGYKIERDAERLMEDAKALEAEGSFAIVLECTPHDLATQVASALTIPVIGIGAGRGCDGQVLVLHDYLLIDGRDPSELPRHAKAYATIGAEILEATRHYVEEVRTGVFPSSEQEF